MIKLRFLTAGIVLLVLSCNSSQEKVNHKFQQQPDVTPTVVSPLVDVKIEAIDTLIQKGEEILLNITLINTNNESQKLLFDKPNSGFGPYRTFAKVINTASEVSALKLNNKAILSSNAYTEDQLEDFHTEIQPGDSITCQYNLSNLVIFSGNQNKLETGEYSIQLFYDSIPSNILSIRIV